MNIMGAASWALVKGQHVGVALWAAEPRVPLRQGIPDLLFPLLVPHEPIEAQHDRGGHAPVGVPVIDFHVFASDTRARGMSPGMSLAVDTVARAMPVVVGALGFDGPRENRFKTIERLTLDLGHFDPQGIAAIDMSLSVDEPSGPVQITNGNHILSCPITHQGLERIQPTDLVYQNNITAGLF